MAMIIRFTVEVEVPEDMLGNHKAACENILSIMENTTASKGFDLYDSNYEEAIA
jgi:hypothetical protein